MTTAFVYDCCDINVLYYYALVLQNHRHRRVVDSLLIPLVFERARAPSETSSPRRSSLTY